MKKLGDLGLLSRQREYSVPPDGRPTSKKTIYKTHPFFGPLLGKDSYKTHFKKTST